ncbi:YdcH family protein [Thiolinea disciformis]|uniref:YdcH family protein n=1 Tax=Thiolinea disciformis TaxID=125614 RepID=UPI00037CBC2F|nr:YdcH family protein [Thiolinea disciformis]
MLHPDEEFMLRNKLFELTQEHRDLDVAIEQLRQNPASDQFMLARMKKRKLALKDQIARIHSQLIPDLNA